MIKSNNKPKNLLNSTCIFLTNSFIEPAISSLVSSLISVNLNIDESQYKEHIIQTISIMKKKILNMPKYIAFGVLILTLYFDWYGVLRNKKRFHRQNLKQQLCQIRCWKNSKIRVFRDFVGFYEKMTMFVYYSISTTLN